MLSVSTAVVTLAAGSAQAADPKKAREKIVELNKQALLSYEAKDFETARDLLTKALKEAKGAGLEDDKMTARTYLHLGAVYWVGFQDQAVALQNFSLAKKIRPDIQLTPSIETADLKSVFDMATAEAEPAPQPATARPVAPVKAQPRAATPVAPASTRLVGDDGGEPDLPATMSAPLMCTVPQDFVPPNKELTIRCALKPGIHASKGVQIHYRAPGVEAYQALSMRRTAKGWYIVTLPSSMMKAGTLQVYFDARNAADNELASNGQIDSPSVIEVRKKGAGKVAGECPVDDPMCQIRRGAAADSYEAGLHRRRQGAFWLGVGAGAGWGFVPGGPLEWRKSIKVSAVTAPVGTLHILPEVGYLWTESFAVSVQAIIETIQPQQLQGETGPTLGGAPANMGFATLGRAIFYSDLGSGNLQFSYSGDVGGGFLRIPIKPFASQKMVDNPSDPNSPQIHDPAGTIYKTDTRPIGIVLLGVSAGFVYHIHRHFALALDGRLLTGVPNFGVILEGVFSAQLAFGGVKGPAPTEEEGVIEGEGGAIKDEPPPVEESSSEE